MPLHHSAFIHNLPPGHKPLLALLPQPLFPHPPLCGYPHLCALFPTSR